MRLYQTWKNYVAQVVLEREISVVSTLLRDRLVALHTDFFTTHSEQDGEQRRDRLNALFDRTLDMYTAALEEGYPEAEAREITHIVAAWEFMNQGWGELLEIPPAETDDYYERYAPFFETHAITPAEPLGEFAPPDGLPDAPATPDRMNGDYPFAEAGLADDVYVHAEADERRLRCEETESRVGATAADG